MRKESISVLTSLSLNRRCFSKGAPLDLLSPIPGTIFAPLQSPFFFFFNCFLVLLTDLSDCTDMMFVLHRNFQINPKAEMPLSNKVQTHQEAKETKPPKPVHTTFLFLRITISQRALHTCKHLHLVTKPLKNQFTTLCI